MAEASLVEGTAVGRYRVRSLIGAGGMGEVYLATDESLGRSAALKILPKELTVDPKRVCRFAAEAKAASALSHPAIVTIYETGEQQVDGRPVQFIAMEWIDGTTLREWLQESPPVAEVLARLAEVSEAIGSAHARGIIHRDLKPDNIMITAEGHAKVLDFGVAKLIEVERSENRSSRSNTLTDAFSVPGTIGYMSPEQVEAMPLDHRTDIFSLGCILYESLTGRAPFAGETVSETLHNIVHRPAPPLALSSRNAKALQPVIDRCLEKDRLKRYDSARDLSLDLRELASRVDRGRGRRLLGRPLDWRWLRRVPAGIGILVLVMLLFRTPLFRIDSLIFGSSPSTSPEVVQLQSMLEAQRQQALSATAALSSRDQEIARRAGEIERLRAELSDSEQARTDLETSYRKLLIEVNADLKRNSSERSQLREKVAAAETELLQFREEQKQRESEAGRLRSIEQSLSKVLKTQIGERGLVITIPGDYFGFGSSNVPSEALGVIGLVAAELKKHPGLKVAIEGHTDSRGGAHGNMELSLERAEAVRHQLFLSGVPQPWMVTAGRGESEPLPGAISDAENRRVEIIAWF